jgi:hypothetical protein
VAREHGGTTTRENGGEAAWRGAAARRTMREDGEGMAGKDREVREIDGEGGQRGEGERRQGGRRHGGDRDRQHCGEGTTDDVRTE